MNILHVVPTYWPAVRYGGPIQSVHGLCAGLVRRGHRVSVYTTNVDGDGVSPVPVGVPVEKDGVAISYFATGLGRRLYRSPGLIAALERGISGFDVAHAHSVFLWPTTALSAAARGHGVPYVVSPRGMLVPELIARKSSLAKTAWVTLFERRNLASAAAVHVTSRLEGADLGRMGLDVRRLAVIGNGIDVPHPTQVPTRIDHLPQPIVLSLGRVSWKKGLDRLISAMAACPGAQLVIAGNDEEGYEPRLREIAGAAGIDGRVHFVGPVHGAEKWRLLAAADLFVLPSYSENFGIALLEAMAVGVPVITTPGVGLAQAISETGAGLVVDGSVAQLGTAIDRLLADATARARMGAAGRRIAREQFSWDSIAEQFEALYASIARPALGQSALRA